MRTILAIALSLASLAAPARAQHPGNESPYTTLAATGVREAERMRAQALNQRDVDVLRRLISGDYYHVETNGRVRSKTEFLQALARDEYRLRGYGLEDMEINVVDNGGTAIVTGVYRVSKQDQPASQPVRGRYVRVWTRHPEGWRNALHQSTEIRSAASGALDPHPRVLQ